MKYISTTQPIKDFCEYHRLTIRQFITLCGISAEDFIDFLDNILNYDVLDKMRKVLGNSAKITMQVD